MTCPILCVVLNRGVAALLVSPAASQTLHWTSQGGARTLDSHTQTETLTNQINGQIHETLVGRERPLTLGRSLALSSQQNGPLGLCFKLRPQSTRQGLTSSASA